jgi:hypothetical protein
MEHQDDLIVNLWPENAGCSLQHHSVSRSIISRGCSLKYLKGSDDYAAAIIGFSPSFT